jgi:hypothetical protein
MARGSLAALLVILAASPRLFRGVAPQVVAIGAGLAGALPTALLAGALAFPGPAALVRMPIAVTYAAVVYGCLAYAYFHLFNMSEAGSLTAEEISRLYSGASVLEARFDRLLATGQLQVRAGRFVNGGRLLYAAASLVRAWRVVLGFER